MYAKTLRASLERATGEVAAASGQRLGGQELRGAEPVRRQHTIEKEHGRLEKRTSFVAADPSALRVLWRDLQGFVMVVRQLEVAGKASCRS